MTAYVLGHSHHIRGSTETDVLAVLRRWWAVCDFAAIPAFYEAA